GSFFILYWDKVKAYKRASQRPRRLEEIMASLPLSPWISRAPVASSSASLVFHAASSPASLSLARSSPRPPLLHCSFLSSSSSSLSFPSSLLS
ncbi:hypothetical protein S245_067645, partial [Arachis hypogaea]